MKHSSFLDTIISRCEELESSSFRTYILAGLAAFAILVAFALYQIRSTSSTLVRKISTGQKTSQQASELVLRNKLVAQKEASFTKLSEEKQLKVGFVQFMDNLFQQHRVHPTDGWKETIETVNIPNNNEFEEKRVRTSFHGQTTEQMVSFIEVLRKEPVVMIREIDIKRKANTLELDLLIATRSTKARA